MGGGGVERVVELRGVAHPDAERAADLRVLSCFEHQIFLVGLVGLRVGALGDPNDQRA